MAKKKPSPGSDNGRLKGPGAEMDQSVGETMTRPLWLEKSRRGMRSERLRLEGYIISGRVHGEHSVYP